MSEDEDDNIKRPEYCNECGELITCSEPSEPGLCEDCYMKKWDNYDYDE